jgi:hypothetical protein
MLWWRKGGEPHAVIPGGDHEPFVAEKADERQVEFPDELGSEAGGRRDAGYDGTPATRAFWMISNSRGPLTSKIESFNGRRFSTRAQPISLSTAFAL